MNQHNLSVRTARREPRANGGAAAPPRKSVDELRRARRRRRAAYLRRRAQYRRRRLVFVVALAAVLVGIVAVAREDPGPARVAAVSEESRAAGVGKDAPETGPPAVSDGAVDVLVLGVDKRPPGSKEAQVDGTRSDTMTVVRTVPDTGEVRTLSVPRDLLVEIEPGVEGKINSAYAYGGVEQARTVTENVTGITVDRYAVVDFAGFEDIVDAMGGVQMDVEDEIPPKYEIKDGPQTLNGEQALFYARYRGTPTADLGRIQRQQRLVGALRGEALSWSTVTELPGIVRTMNENVETNLGLWETISLARALANHEDAGVASLRLEGAPETLPDGQQVLAPDGAANEKILEKFRGPQSALRKAAL